MTDSAATSQQPRREATPLRWAPDSPGTGESLTATQRQAAAQLWALFHNYYLDQAPSRSRYAKSRRRPDKLGEAMPVIDDERRNQILLLDGERGSGKTALLITLLDAWARSVAGDTRVRNADGIGRVCDPHGRVVPIGLLDLRALPNNTSLLLQISGKLRGLVDALGLGHTPTSPPIAPDYPEANTAHMAWAAFQAAAASTEHSTRKRSAELDPESFAVELLDTELDRLHVDARFAELIDHLVEAYEQRVMRARGGARIEARDTPVFVLAIDDADMNPARIGECFELLDTLEHPRLIILLTGCSGLFVHGLRAQFLGELRRPLGRTTLSDAERERLGDLDEAFELAQRYYDKLVPRNHRCELPPLEVNDRVRLVRKELDSIRLGEANVGVVFERLPYLGKLLPGHLRDLDDFRFELARCANDGPLAFLMLMRDRVSRELGSDAFDVNELLPAVEGTLFDTKPINEVTTWPLVVTGWVYQHTVRELEHGFDRTELYNLVRFGVRRRPPDDAAQEDLLTPDLLDERVALFATLIEYLAPFVSGLLTAFKSGVNISAGQLLSSQVWLKDIGGVRFNWPLPPNLFEGWRSFEFARLWRRTLDHLTSDRVLDDDKLELVALNYLASIIHTTSAKLSDEDPVLLSTPASERGAQWRALISQLQALGTHVTWHNIHLLELAHPESRLSADAAARVLDAWVETYEAQIPGLEQFQNADAMLAQSERQRWGNFTHLAPKHKTTAVKLHTKLRERFPDHPWTQRLRSLVSEDLLAPLRAALERIPVEHSSAAPWLPETAAGYLSQRTTLLLHEGGPSFTTPMVEAINYGMKESGNVHLALYQAWLRRGSRDYKDLINYNDFTLIAPENLDVNRTHTLDTKPSMSAIAGKQWRIYAGQVEEPPLEAAALALFRIIHDFVQDRARGENRNDTFWWKLLRIFKEGDPKPTCTWPAVAWNTHIDYDLVTERWRLSLANEEYSGDKLGRIARRYVELQARTYESRVLAPSEHDDPPMAWPELFEFARSNWDEATSDYNRASAYHSWLKYLEQLTLRAAALPPVEAAAAFVAYHEVLYPMFPRRRAQPWMVIWDRYAWSPFDGPPPSEEGWIKCQNSNARRVIINEIRARFVDEAPELFAPPPARVAAVEALRTALTDIELPRLPGTSTQASLGAYLSPDLIAHSLRVYTGTITRVTEALASTPGLYQRLHAAWLASRPDNPQAVRITTNELEVEGSHDATFYLPGLEGADEDNPSAHLSSPWSCTGEFDLEYALYPGIMTTPIDEDFPTVIHALLHDVVRDRLPPSTTLAPTRWPLARVARGAKSYAPWPAVQWPTRYDRQLQLRAWKLDFERRKDPAAESLSARARVFMASTVHVFEQRKLYEQATGSWKDVILSAYRADARDETSARAKAFHAWYLQLPRFALPRVGLSLRHAADILVRFYDITKLDLRGELIGRIDKVSDATLEFDTPLDDHPAVLVAGAKTAEDLACVIDSLRERYELA